MWKVSDGSDSLGLATWSDDKCAWTLDARGGKQGVMLLADEADRDTGATDMFRFAGVDGPIPAAAEQFVRGNEFHVHFPQGESHFGLRMVFEPIESSAERFVLEVTISIQTSLLDSHPVLDVVVDGQATGIQPADTGAPAISIVESEERSTAVLLGRHDSPFTTNQSNNDQLSYRLFGEFLEKGVIRKARPWFVITDDGDPKQLENLLDQLNESPLPLTP